MLAAQLVCVVALFLVVALGELIKAHYVHKTTARLLFARSNDINDYYHVWPTWYCGYADVSY